MESSSGRRKRSFDSAFFLRSVAVFARDKDAEGVDRADPRVVWIEVRAEFFDRSERLQVEDRAVPEMAPSRGGFMTPRDDHIGPGPLRLAQHVKVGDHLLLLVQECHSSAAADRRPNLLEGYGSSHPKNKFMCSRFSTDVSSANHTAMGSETSSSFDRVGIPDIWEF